MSNLNFQRRLTVPGVLAGSTMYVVKTADPDLVELHFSDATGTNSYHIIHKADVELLIDNAVPDAYESTDKLTTARHITITGDAAWDVLFDGTSDASAILTLSNTGVSAGEYTVLTVDVKGRATAGRSLVAADIPNLPGGKIISAISVDTTGNAATATKLVTARTINGVSFDGSDNITINAVDSTARIAALEKAAPNGVATLDGSGKVHSDQLPDYVDDVIEVVDFASLPVTGSTGKIYVAIDTGYIYRWSGSVYIQITGGVSQADAALKLNTARNISTIGDATWTVSFDGSANVSAAITLSNSGVTAGSYTKVTVNSKGIVTAGTSLSQADAITAIGYTPVNKAGDSLTGALNYNTTASVASAATTNIGAATSNSITITGTTTITSLGTIAAGAVRYLTFAASLTLTHNGISLILPTGGNIVTGAGDSAEFVSLGGGSWKCLNYERANGVLQSGTYNGPVNLKRGADIASASTINLDTATGDIVNVTGTTQISAITLADGGVRRVRFAASLTLTNNAAIILPGGANIVTGAGDWAEFVSYGGGVVYMTYYSRLGGTAITSSSVDILTNKTLANPIITNFTESGVSVSNVTGTYTVNLANGTDIELNLIGATAVTIPSPTGNAGRSFTITANYTGNQPVTWTGGALRWSNNNTPPNGTNANGKADKWVFVCNRAGTAWFAQDGGRNF